MPTEDVRAVIQDRLRSGKPPDVFTYDTGPGFGGVLAAAGLLRPLGEAYRENGWDIYDWARRQVLLRTPLLVAVQPHSLQIASFASSPLTLLA
jgi:hypothetical protein